MLLTKHNFDMRQ